MKRIYGLVLLAAIGIPGVLNAQDTEEAYAPSFRYCPDRDFDIAWENDRVAFRVYGKQPDADAGLSGIDAWHKRVSYPIVDKWYREHLEGKSYHKDHGEGCDQYQVGKTRGVGGIGLWHENAVLPSGTYEDWEVVSLTQTTLVFRLVYSWEVNGQRMVENRITTIENGTQLFSAVSHFTRNGHPVKDLEIAVGVSTQNGTAEVTLNEDQGWMSAWHALGDNQGMIGTGALVDTGHLVRMVEQESREEDQSQVLAIIRTDSNGCIKWKAGFAWEKAGRITSREDWSRYLAKNCVD